MQFRSVHQLNSDLATWSESLPDDIDLVVGIPRSGLLAATMLALHLHLPLADLDGLLEGRVLGGGKRIEAALPPGEDLISAARRILVLDDSTNRGGSIVAAKARLADAPHLRDKIVWGAPYVTPGAAEGLLDVWYEKVPQPRAFEWNVLHHSGLVNAAMSLEGVLCAALPDEAAVGASRYAAALAGSRARLVPASPVGWLVTTRPEQHRAATEAWLGRHGIRYRELVMAPAGKAPGSPRQEARLKADAYRRARAWLFVEESAEQAVEIAHRAGRPVYCTSARQMAYPGVELGAPARRRDERAWRREEQVRLNRLRIESLRRRILSRVPGAPSQAG